MATLNVDYAGAMKNMGLPLEGLTSHGVKVMVSPQGVKLTHEGVVLAVANIAPAKLAEIASSGFKPQDPVHATIKTTLQAALAKALNELSPQGVDAAKVPKPAVAEMPAATTVTGIETFPVGQMKTGALVPLATATKLFQPVPGTSQGSRYYVVGVGPGIKVAARLQAQKLSLRIEGPKFSAMAPKIIEAGVFGVDFNGSFQGNYASMHVTCENKMAAQRIIGAVLGALPGEIVHPVPDLAPLVNAA